MMFFACRFQLYDKIIHIQLQDIFQVKARLRKVKMGERNASWTAEERKLLRDRYEQHKEILVLVSPIK